MSVIDKIQERLDRGYDGAYGDILNDLSTVLILFRAKNKAIEVGIDKLKDYANFSNDYDRAEFAINILKNLL